MLRRDSDDVARHVLPADAHSADAGRQDRVATSPVALCVHIDLSLEELSLILQLSEALVEQELFRLFYDIVALLFRRTIVSILLEARNLRRIQLVGSEERRLHVEALTAARHMVRVLVITLLVEVVVIDNAIFPFLLVKVLHTAAVANDSFTALFNPL